MEKIDYNSLLTNEEKKWPSMEELEKAKSILSIGLYNNIWKNKYSKRTYSGPCVYACRVTVPKSIEDFYENGYKANPKMSIENLIKLAYKWREACGNPKKIPLKVFFHGVLAHNFWETYEGHLTETYVRQILIKCGFTLNDSDDRMDTNLGVDIAAEKNGKSYYFQVKVVSFFLGMQTGQIDHRRKVFTKSIPNQIKENEGKELPKYIWIIYDFITKKFFFNPYTNNFRFDVTEVIDTSETVDEDYKKYPLTDKYKEVFLTLDGNKEVVRNGKLPMLNEKNMRISLI